MLAVCALGLSLFHTGGLSELCSEEIYFWTFLNLVIWLLAIVSTGAGGSWRWNDTANEPGNAAWRAAAGAVESRAFGGKSAVLDA
jgi:hypothetical protein